MPKHVTETLDRAGGVGARVPPFAARLSAVYKKKRVDRHGDPPSHTLEQIGSSPPVGPLRCSSAVYSYKKRVEGEEEEEEGREREKLLDRKKERLILFKV